jgi:hypothetical protein
MSLAFTIAALLWLLLLIGGAHDCGRIAAGDTSFKHPLRTHEAALRIAMGIEIMLIFGVYFG